MDSRDKTGTTKKATILIVEDETIVAFDLKNTLEKLGYLAPRIESTGQDAIRAARELSPDLILMDIMLKGELNGVAAAARILERQNIPVIYLTAYLDQATVDSAKVTKPYGYILKPYDEQDLQTTIEMALYKHAFEKQLEEKEQWLSVTLQNIADAVITTDAGGIITFSNDAAVTLTGFPRADSEGHPFTDIIRMELPPDNRPCTIMREIFGNAAGEGPLQQICEGMLVTRTGTRVPVTSQVALINDAAGTLTGTVVVLRDDTRQRLERESLQRSEEQYRNLVEHTPIAIIIHIKKKVVFLNKAAVSMFGGEDRESLLGRNIQDFIAPEYHPVVDARLQNINSDPRQVPTIQERFLRLDGTTFDVEVSAVPFTYEGEPAVFVVAHDITERTRLEEELRQSHKMEAIGRLAGGIAHDFNNLLTAIIGYSDLGLVQLKQEDPLYSEMEQIRKAATRAAGLTRQLLAFSRRQVLQPKIINLNTIISEMEKLLQRVIGENITLQAQYGDDIHLVKADATQIQQVLMNLSINARDAMPAGGNLTIRTGNVRLDNRSAIHHGLAADGDYVTLTIQDTGTGIEERIKDHIFEPFFTTKQPGEGTGLGLSTVYGIVKQSGGDITVRSTPGKGSEFRILFPAVPEPHSEDTADSVGERGKAGHETILLVEDEEMVRSLASTILTQSGYTVFDAVNGKDAIRMLDHLPASLNLLITDLIMPEVSGVELQEAVTRRFPGIRVLYMSGYTEKGPSGKTNLDPGIPFLQKPFTLNELIVKVREVLDAPPGNG